MVIPLHWLLPTAKHSTRTMTLPCALLLELRLAFKTCARQYTAHQPLSRAFGTFQPLSKRNSPRPSTSKKTASPSGSSKHNVPVQDGLKLGPEVTPMHAAQQNSTELVPNPSKQTSVADRKRADLPMKVIPKAQITPELMLSPKERLQIEFMTRRPPRTTEAKKGMFQATKAALFLG